MNKSGIEKTTIKSLIALLIFSSVLEIRISNLSNYFIFVLAWLIVTALYEFYKYSSNYIIGDKGVTIKTLMKENLIPYGSLVDVFLVNGFLQKRFALSSVYLVKQNTTIPIRDIKNGEAVLGDIQMRIGKSPNVNESKLQDDLR